MALEEIRDITFGLWGQELSHEQTIQRIVAAGFPIKGGVALTMFAIVEGESGEYQRAFHVNCERWPEDARRVLKIKRYVFCGQPTVPVLLQPDEEPAPDEHAYMKVKSIDLGFMQRNVPVAEEYIELDYEAVDAWVNGLFDGPYSDLANPWLAAEDAYELWTQRGFQPWYAYKPGDPKFRLKKRYGALAFTRWLIRSFVGPDPKTGKLPRVDFV